jgi:hypothetical protein
LFAGRAAYVLSWVTARDMNGGDADFNALDSRRVLQPNGEMTVQSLFALVAAVALAAPASAPYPAPERVQQRNSIVSLADPAATVRVPRGAVYVGSERWPLYDVADCELHVFVEADANKRVKRFYWIQFEQYLPEQARAQYNYAKPVNVREAHWGKIWWRRARFGSTSEVPQTGSEIERVYRLIAKAGFTLPLHMINVRLVRMLDDPADSGKGRKELILFYNEDMAPVAVGSEDFITDGKINAKWAPVEKALVERAVKRFAVHWAKD